MQRPRPAPRARTRSSARTTRALARRLRPRRAARSAPRPARVRDASPGSDERAAAAVPYVGWPPRSARSRSPRASRTETAISAFCRITLWNSPRESTRHFIGQRGDGRGAGPTVEQRDLPEEIARPELAQVAALAPDLRRPGEDHEELAATRALAAEIPSRDEVHLVDLRRDERELPVIAFREQGHRLQHRYP